MGLGRCWLCEAIELSGRFPGNGHGTGTPIGHRGILARGETKNVSTNGDQDREFMQAAINEARAAGKRGEVPIGAVVVVDGRIVARAGNRTITDCDPTAHAEIVALRATAKTVGNYRLLAATMYVTIEPCAMCAGALIQARVARLVYGADDAKAGAVRSSMALLNHPQLNHRVEVTAGVSAEEGVGLMREFFAARR
jgi:tRNA(adenine34) deaminase